MDEQRWLPVVLKKLDRHVDILSREMSRFKVQ
jgi:hypothetical protein